MSIAWSIPKAKRKTKNRRQPRLGPGAYDPQLDPYKRRFPSWSMGGRYKKKMRNKNPGPGSYNHNKKGKTAPKYSIAGKYEEKKGSNFYAPGPGTYSQDKLKKNLRYSMGAKLKAPKDTTQSPGPANYDVINTEKWKDKAPMWSMGGSRVEQLKDQKVPGPGTYDRNGTLIKKGAFIGSSERKPISKNGAPGPGTYQIKGIVDENIFHNKGKSLSSRHQLRKKDQTPAPDHYNSELGFVKRNAPAYKFGSTSRATKDRNVGNPAPDAYSPSIDPVRKNGPKWGIGTEAKGGGKNRNQNPGPGTYDHLKDKNEKPQFSFGLKLQKARDTEKVPGPGNYNPNASFVQKSLELGKIGTERREGVISKEKNPTPGPGTYAKHSELGKIGAKIGTEKRSDIANQSKVPGPGNYQIKSIFEENPGKGKTMGMKLKTKKESFQVGPGSYDPKLTLSKRRAIGAKVGTSKRTHKNRNRNPGPGQYDHKMRSSLPSWKIGSEPRGKTKRNLNPGPGTYDSRGISNKKHRFAMGIKLKNRRKELTPGPGAYEPSYKLTRNSNIVGGKVGGGIRSRHTRSSQDPGPGQYDVSGKLNKKGIRFGTGGRHNLKKDHVPGPGSYKLPPVIADVPHYSMPGGKKKIDYP